MRIRSAVEIEDPAAGAEPSNRERRIKAGYRRLLRAVLDGKGGESKVQSLKSKVRHPKRGARAAEVYLSRFLCVGFALALAVTGCAGPRPLKGGKAVTTRKPAGVIEQTLVQGENPAQATKQDQETVKVRTYTVPAGSRVEQSQPRQVRRRRSPNSQPSTLRLAGRSPSQPPTLNSQLSTLNHLHPQRSNAGGRARGNPRPDGAGRGAEGHGARAGGQACPASRALSGWAWACSCSAWRRWCIRRSRWSSAA